MGTTLCGALHKKFSKCGALTVFCTDSILEFNLMAPRFCGAPNFWGALHDNSVYKVSSSIEGDGSLNYKWGAIWKMRNCTWRAKRTSNDAKNYFQRKGLGGEVRVSYSNWYGFPSKYIYFWYSSMLSQHILNILGRISSTRSSSKIHELVMLGKQSSIFSSLKQNSKWDE